MKEPGGLVPHCGKCNSTTVYRDVDPGTGVKSIACLKCGNRWPGGVEFYMADCKTGRRALDGGHQKRKEIVMAIRECRNCGREKTVVGDGCCFVCYNAGKGLEGDKKVAALAAAKERIEGGGLRCGGSRQSKKAAKKPITAEEKSSKEMMTSLRDGEPSPRPIEHPPNNHVIPLTICLEFEIGIRLTSLSG